MFPKRAKGVLLTCKDLATTLRKKYPQKCGKFNKFNYKSVRRVLKKLPNLKVLDLRGTIIQIYWPQTNNFHRLCDASWNKDNRLTIFQFIKALGLKRKKYKLYRTVVKRFLKTKEAGNNVLKILDKLREKGLAKNLKKVICTTQNLIFTYIKPLQSVKDVEVVNSPSFCKSDKCEWCLVPRYCEICKEPVIPVGNYYASPYFMDKELKDFHLHCFTRNHKHITVTYKPKENKIK